MYEDYVDILDQKTLHFLLNANSVLQSQSCFKLKNYLKIHSSNVSDHLAIKLPKSWTNKNNNCQYCFTPWVDGKYTFKLLRAHQVGKQMQKLIKKDKNDLRLLEKKLVALVESSADCNKMVLTCLICHKDNPFVFKKVNKAKPSIEMMETPDAEKTRKKKRKKKDRFAGLTPQACQPSSETPSASPVLQTNIQAEDNDIEILSCTAGHSNSLATPLGMKSKVEPSCSTALTFIPLSSHSDKKKKKKKKKEKVGKEEKQTMHAGLLVNPFATPTSAKPDKQTKSSKLYRMMMESQKQATRSRSSLKDFLSLCK